MNRPFFSRLSYSFGNEDSLTERKALSIQPTDRIVCITASGDRPLHLLQDDCQEVVSIDLNPIQNHLLQLKMAAIAHLDFASYLAFLGISSHQDRLSVLEQLLPYLSDSTAAYWKEHRSLIQKGIIYQGTMEKTAWRMARMISFLRKSKIKQLFDFDDIEQQRKFLKEKWNTPLWHKTINTLLHPSLTKLWIKDPGLYEHLGPSVSPGSYILEKMNQCLYKNLAKENLILSFVFLGKVGAQAFPPYLTEKGVSSIKPRLNKIFIRNHNIIHFLENEPPNSFDCYSLSDVISYINSEDYERLLNAIYRTAKPGARFCLRQFMSSCTIPREWHSKLCRDFNLEKELENEDRTFLYRFIVGKVSK